jgi:predicted HTH transcriptional regulator
MVYPEKESVSIEFKESLPQNNQILKTIVGFCNQKGGKIIIGVSDDGTIKGLTDSDIAFALEHKELEWSTLGKSFDTMPVHTATVEDLDTGKIQQFITSRKNGEQSTTSLHDALKAYNLIITEHGRSYPKVAGVLLFGKEPNNFFREAFIICTVFKGVEGREIIVTRDCWGTLFEQLKRAENFILSELNRSYSFTGLKTRRTIRNPRNSYTRSSRQCSSSQKLPYTGPHKNSNL